jgi:ATP-dependent DNA ligase
MASVVPSFSPMLASSAPVAAPASRWAFEPKLDGWRVLVSVDGDLTVRTRNGHNVTGSVPELTPMVDALEGLVAKRLDSRYRPGERSREWVKAKCPDWREGRRTSIAK